MVGYCLVLFCYCGCLFIFDGYVFYVFIVLFISWFLFTLIFGFGVD